MVHSLAMIDFHELKPDELDTALTFRNSMFTSVGLDHWHDMNCTAVVAWDEDTMIGCIPLQFRRQKIKHNVSIPVVYENAVGVAADRRSQGVGTEMIRVAADFIKDRADALMVVRGGEQTDGYRFYRKSGHSDLMYVSSFSKEAGSPLEGSGAIDVESVDVESWLAEESRLLELYESLYGQYGGGRARGRGYWDTIFSSHVFRNRGWELFIARRDSEVVGYLVSARGTWTDLEDLHVYEVVGRESGAVAELLRNAREKAGNTKLVVPSVGLANPLREVLLELGFEESETTPHIMARILRPERIFRVLVGAEYGNEVPTELESLVIKVTTPHRSFALHEPQSPQKKIHLQMKESTLCRLLFCRLDLKSALDTEIVRWPDRDAGIEQILCRVFEFCRWIQWFSDYV